MAQVTLHTAAPINHRMPTGGDVLALNNRVAAFGSGHLHGANFAFADTHVQFVRDTIAASTLRALSTRVGEEVVSEDDY